MDLRLEAAGAAAESGPFADRAAPAPPWGGGPRRALEPRLPDAFDDRDEFSELLRMWMGRRRKPVRGSRAAPLDAIAELSRQRLQNGSMSFARAARLFPPHLRASAFMLYAWCRHCDDEIDGQILGAAPAGGRLCAMAAEQKLDALRQQTLAALAGDVDEASDPVFVGLHRVVAAHNMPARYPIDLLDGMAMDVAGRKYATLDDTLTYAYYVAGVVGVMMATIMGVRDRATLERASDLGIAFQLTNIARDIVPDARHGRVYLPAEWLREAGVPLDEVADPRHRRAVFSVAARLLTVADAYYHSAAAGIGRLPWRCAWAIASARRVYRGIGHVVRAKGERAWDARARTSALGQSAGIALASVEASAFVAARGLHRPKSREGLWTPAHLWGP